MKQILEQLDKGNPVLIETKDLPEFLEYSMKQPGYRSFRYDYSENMVTITQTDLHIIIKHQNAD